MSEAAALSTDASTASVNAAAVETQSPKNVTEVNPSCSHSPDEGGDKRPREEGECQKHKRQKVEYQPPVHILTDYFI